jgi:hypothetical protein
MDEKTLQYMGERVDKARGIKKKIAELKDVIKYSDDKNDVALSQSGRGRVLIESQSYSHLAARAKLAVLAEVEREIKLLEQELAEL